MTEARSETACDWTVSGMDCGSCATKIKDAVARLLRFDPEREA